MTTLSITTCMGLMLTGFVYAGAVTHPGGSNSPPNATVTVTATATRSLEVTTGAIDVNFNPEYFGNSYAQVNYTAISSQVPNDVLSQLAQDFGAGNLTQQLAQMESSGNPSDLEFLNANYGPGMLAYSAQESSNGTNTDSSGVTLWTQGVQNTLAIEEATIGERTASWSTSSSYLGSATVFSDAGITGSSTTAQQCGAFTVGSVTELTDTQVQTNATVYEYDGSKYVSPIVLDLPGTGRLEASNGQWLPHGNRFDRSHVVAFDFYDNGF
ncbi:MAG: hypothetical protein ACYCW6_19905, partial [Candidatus Xenobia bacterium]